MNYFVIGPDGQKYGPADINTLNAWAIEGRVVPHTILENVSTGQQVTAANVPGIVFPQVGYGGPQFGGTYQRPNHVNMGYNPQALTTAWILGVIGLCCFGFSIGGIIIASQEKARGNPNAQAALIFCIITGIINFCCGGGNFYRGGVNF